MKACLSCPTTWYGDPSDEVNVCPTCGDERETALGEARKVLREGGDVEEVPSHS